VKNQRVLREASRVLENFQIRPITIIVLRKRQRGLRKLVEAELKIKLKKRKKKVV